MKGLTMAKDVWVAVRLNWNDGWRLIEARHEERYAQMGFEIKHLVPCATS
jgi:hypothetical protein